MLGFLSKSGDSAVKHRRGLVLQPLKGFWLPVSPVNPRPAFLNFPHTVVKGKISAYNSSCLGGIKFVCFVPLHWFHPSEADE